ncbi:MAG: PEGA domain-containing protein, partial [Deltaproteobacteria bacterium]|nr:PEGA domain-containing protein [Deltaproteobacteria bacterium]
PVPRVGASLSALPRARARPAARPGRLVWVLMALVIAALGGVAVWAMTRGGGVAPVDAAVVTPPPPVDAPPRPVETMGTLEVVTFPPGALVTIGDKQLGPSPASAKVTAGAPVRVKLELHGYETLEVEYTLEPGQTRTIEKSLVAALATVHIETTPAGAQVASGGRQLCAATPCDPRLDASAKEVELVLTKDKHETVRVKVALVAGETAKVVQALKELQRFGRVQINVTGTPVWAQVWHQGRSLGITKDVFGITQFQLPAGRQTLLLRWNEMSRQLPIEVVEGKTIVVPFSWN